ncbi:MAG: methyltransferase domain-containing protein [Candidatus Cloacimonetes bacterium]|nr:methyltransferase domain-containing protein [Candidatus Cloacimonadota bacterium]
MKEEVKKYYSEVLQKSSDLQTNACCSIDDVDPEIKKSISKIHPEIVEKFYGCGSPIPTVVQGKVILDLGCGSGRDVYILSGLVGESGSVIGVDMTDEQLDVAIKHQDYQRDQFSYSKSNVSFKKGYIEDLKALNIEDNTVDIIISNCVINLSPDKKSVFNEIYRVLKPGGELFFSDIYSDRRIPKHLQEDPELYGECLSGAMYKEDFRRLMFEVGFKDVRLLNSGGVTVDNPIIEKKLGNIHFTSETLRAFKIPELEDRCEDFGQVATYKGGIENSEHFYQLDDHHTFELNRPMLVCSNTARMLYDTRLSSFFEVIGDESTHFGLFDCAPSMPVVSKTGTNEDQGGGCC